MTTDATQSVRNALAAALDAAPSGTIVDSCLVDLPATEPPWYDTGLVVEAGDRVTIVRDGRITLGDLWLPAGFNVWARVGGRGPLERGTRPSHTFTATRGGHLELGHAQPSEWRDQNGAIADDPAVYALMAGGATVFALRWSPEADVVAILRDLADAIDGSGPCFFGAEADRLEGNLGAAPEGWEHLWYVGPSEVFSAGAEGITCATQGDASIICHEAEVALRADTTLSWEWMVAQLPSAYPENTFETHDYMSIAVEFDDGQDLTYHWSAALEPETIYRCPLPHWSERETHLVVRSGSDGLGEWSHQSRAVLTDHQAAIGGQAPKRIVRVWLIALSCMQRLEGRCAYRNIELGDGNSFLRID
jgi:hypothetical protein